MLNLKSIARHLSFLIAAAVLFCPNVSAQTRTQGRQTLNDLKLGYAKISPHHFTSTWVTANFDIKSGASKIIWTEGENPKQEFSRLRFSYVQNKPDVGFDIGAGRITGTKTVADLSTLGHNGWTSPALDRTLRFQFTDKLHPVDDGLPTHRKAYWWMGPKVIIYSKQAWGAKAMPDADRLGGEYECYIVVDSNLTRDELRQRANLQYVGKGLFGTGSSKDIYHHYVTSLPFTQTNGQPNQINQVWTIKDTYSKKAEVPVNRIQRDWMTKFRPNTHTPLVPWNFYNLGWKINLETSGQFSTGSAGWEGLRLPANDF